MSYAKQLRCIWLFCYLVLQLQKDQLLNIHQNKSKSSPELLPSFTAGWGEGGDDVYLSWDVVSVQITNKKWMCVQEAEGVYTCLCANAVFLLQEEAICALGGNTVVCILYLT